MSGSLSLFPSSSSAWTPPAESVAASTVERVGPSTVEADIYTVIPDVPLGSLSELRREAETSAEGLAYLRNHARRHATPARPFRIYRVRVRGVERRGGEVVGGGQWSPVERIGGRNGR